MAKIKTHWVKTTPFGDYRNTPDRKNSRLNRNTMIIREAKSLGVSIKHPGSKPINNLLNGIAKAHEAQTASKPINNLLNGIAKAHEAQTASKKSEELKNEEQ